MVETFDVSITPYGLTRRTFVYLPDDCQTSGKKYPVLYMFDGHNLFFDSTATYGTCWGLKEYCDAHPNWIIAAPECNHEGNKRLEEYCRLLSKNSFSIFSPFAMIFRRSFRNDAVSLLRALAVVMKLSHSSLGVCDLEGSISTWSPLCSFWFSGTSR